MTLRSRSCVIGRGVAMFSICSAMALASKMPDPDRQHLLPVLVAQDDDRHVGDRVDHQPLDRHFDLHGSYNLGAVARTLSNACTARPHTLCGPARSIATGTVRPIHAGRPGQVDDHVRAASARTAPSRAAGSPRRPAPRPSCPTSALVQRRLNLPLQRLQRHDPPRLLLLRHIVGQPLVGQRVRPRRVLEREHAVVAAPPRSATACPRSPRRSRPGNPTIMSVDSATSGSASRMRATRSR